MPKFNAQERSLIQTIVATLSLKRLPDAEIIKEIFAKTNKTETKQSICNIRNRIKKDSSKWYSQLKQGEHEYIHEFKERINEIVDLQRQHHEIILKNQHNPSVVQTSLAEFHKLNITLSNYFDVAPSICNTSISETQATTRETKGNINNQDIIV